MKSLLLPALALVLILVSCEKASPPPVAEVPAAAPVDDSALREARDALARQAMEVETRSALLDKQLAELEARLQQSENEALRGLLEALRQQNDQLRTQADTARKQSDTLTQRLAASTPANALAPPTAPRDYAVFYERLAPHGRWIDVSGHGLCFQPRLARNRTWRPYVDGCWGWSSLGWTWQTSEPFGWATYHYGRWLNLTSHGWLWVPGCEWAPAWVAWRQSRDHIGWAPLPPESGPCAPVRRDCDTRYNLGPASYTFVRTTHFVRPSYSTCIQPVSYNSTLFHHTVNITQIVPCGGGKPGGTPLYMHHGGPPRHQIEETCRQPVPQPQIRPVELAQMAIKPITIQPPGGSAPVLEIVQLPAATQNRLPALRPAERIENPILANPYAGVPASARPAIQQTLAAEVRQVVLADSPRPMAVNATPEAPATPTASTPSTTETTTSPTEPIPALTANLSAPIENTGAQPQITPPTLPPALVVSTSPNPSDLSDKSDPSDLPASAQPSPSTATLPPATPEPTKLPVIPPAADEAVRVAAERQAQMAAAQQQQADETARRADEEETARQAQMQAQTQAAETQRQAQEQAQQQAQMEAARLAQEESQMAAQRQAEETARQQAEAAAMAQRQAAEEAQRQAQMEAQRQAEEAARRAAEEAQRQAQMEAQRQAQMEAQRQAEEAARRAAEEVQRQAQMEAQRQAEEAARRAAEEAQRQAQMEAQRQAEEAARRAAEEAQRQAAEEAARQAAAAAAAAAQQPSPPPQ